jgi:hypothetical protein
MKGCELGMLPFIRILPNQCGNGSGNFEPPNEKVHRCHSGGLDLSERVNFSILSDTGARSTSYFRTEETN